MRRAFTLIEVNLAILIMAGGVLAMVSLFSFGYRENSQSREDVAGAAIADAVVSPLLMACSATNLKWSVFRQGFEYPSGGWAGYMNTSTGLVTQDPQDTAQGAFSDAIRQMGSAAEGSLDVNETFPASAFSKGMRCGLVVIHEEDSPVVKIAVRATHRASMLMAMPIYYTEARFQGLPDK